MIKIIHVLTDTNIGGAGIWLLNFLKSYDRDALDVSVAIPENAALEAKIAELGVKIHVVKYIADSSFSKKAVGEFKKLFITEKPDIIHTHACLSARIAAKQCKIKTVNTRHCFEPKKSFPKSIIYRFINNTLSDVVIGVSEAIVENLRRDGISDKKLRLVYNGSYPLSSLTDEEKSEVRDSYGIADTQSIVGIVARLEPVKQVELFIEAASVLKQRGVCATYIIAGIGSCYDQLKETAHTLGLDSDIIFAGYLSDVSRTVNIFDVSVLTSKEEALSLSLIEAMSIGKPCVSTDSIGPREVISDGESGFIVANGDPEALADKIQLLLDDQNMRNTFGAVGRKIAAEKFSVDAMANKLLEIYTELKSTTEVLK